MKLISRTESFIGLAFLCVFCIYFLPTSNSEIRIHDTFDGNFSTRHVLVNSGHFFDTDPTSVVPGIMNGLPRGVFPRFTEITSLLMYFFGSLNGFAIGFILIRILAFVGVYLFGRDHVRLGQEKKGLLVLMAAAFAALPFFTIHGLTVAGVPLLLWAIFNLYKKQKAGLSYSALVLFVLWSNFVLVGVHVLFALGILFLYFSVKDRKIHFRLLFPIALIGILYVVSDYMLFYMHGFNKNYSSSRGEMERFLGLNLSGVIGGTVKTFFSGHYSTANYFGFLFVPFFAFYIVDSFKRRGEDLNRQGFFFLAVTAFFCLMISVLDWKSFAFFYERFPFAKVFNLKRFTSLLPGFFFVTGLIMVIIANRRDQMIVRVCSSLVICSLFVFLWRGNISYLRSGFDTMGEKISGDQPTTFKQFFDPVLYSSIKKEMGSDTMNNVIHFGISPSPSKYAGLQVLDDYQGDYPKLYKEEFRKIIELELNKSESLKNYFDGWGGRCYMYSARLFDNTIDYKVGVFVEPKLEINTAQIKSMNAHCILSGGIIGNSKELGLELKRIFVSETDFKKVLLYKII